MRDISVVSSVGLDLARHVEMMGQKCRVFGVVCPDRWCVAVAQEKRGEKFVKVEVLSRAIVMRRCSGMVIKRYSRTRWVWCMVIREMELG